MSASEIFYSVMPILWLCSAGFIFKEEPGKKILLRWGIMVAACMLVGFLMLYRISGMMGSRVNWVEVLYYGWFLSALFSILQFFKKVLSTVLKKIILWPRLTVRTVLIKTLHYAVLFVVMVPFFLAMTSVHRVKVGDVWNPRTALGLVYEAVSWKTADGLNIKGWYIPAASDNAVLIAHGLGANKSNFIETVALWHQLGFNVLIFDFRGHGESDGHTVTFGYRERLDVIGGWNFLTKIKKFIPNKIIGYGVSFGGAALVNATDQIHGFQKLIIDSSYASLDDMAMHIVESEPVIPIFLRPAFKEIGLFFIRLDVGFDIRNNSPEKIIGNLAGTPILFIHGKGDPLIHWTQSQRLFARAGQPKQLYILDTQGHFGTFNDPGYQVLIKSFLAT